MATESRWFVREYRDDDADAVRECIIELQDFERRIDDRLRLGRSMAADYFDQMRQSCRECAGSILVVECDGAVAGFATVLARVPFEALDDPPGERAVVTDLVVREGFRRRGFALALLAAAERRAVDAGATELRIGVLSENHGARTLYERVGFAPYLHTLAKRLDATRGGG